MTYCVCGSPEGTNKECERCTLIAECIRLTELMQCIAACGIEHTSTGKYHCVQIDLALWDEICSHSVDDDDDIEDYLPDEYVSPETQKRNDAMERGDEMRDRAKDER